MLDDPAEEAVAQLLADVVREGRLQFGAVVAEYNAEIAALRVQNAELRAEIAERGAQVAALMVKVDARLAAVKDGAPGERGEIGPVGPIGERGEKGDPGADAPPPAEGLIAAAVAKYLEANPPPAGRDGKDGAVGPQGPAGDRGEKGEPGRDGIDGKDGVDGPLGAKGDAGEKGLDGKDGRDGKDGIGMAGALIDRDGNLVITMTDGAAKSLGIVIGRDGVDGAPGRDGSPGINGKDGADGVIKLDLADVHKGPWKAGVFERGNLVTMGGSTWLATASTESRPGTDETWRLIVKAGRDGKDGRDLGPAPPATVRA